MQEWGRKNPPPFFYLKNFVTYIGEVLGKVEKKFRQTRHLMFFWADMMIVGGLSPPERRAEKRVP